MSDLGHQGGRRTRVRIALLLDAFNATYQTSIVRYVRDACRQRHLELVVLPGGIIEGQDRGASFRNRVYRLITPTAFDGVIVLGSTIDQALGPERFAQFCEALAPLPICCLGCSPSGIPSVSVDNGAGMKALVRHLIRVHGYTRIAFIRGPETNEEAEARFQAYQQALRAGGLRVDPALVTSGDFLSESGIQAVHTLLDERRLSIDCIVACNDYMALGAMEAVASHPLCPVRGIPVVGFDDVDEASFASPALTTVRQPLEQMAHTAVRHVLLSLGGSHVPPPEPFVTSPVFRGSCGCLSRDARRRPEPDAPPGGLAPELELVRRREGILTALARAAGPSVAAIPNWDTQLLDALMDEVRGVSGNLFAIALDNLLGQLLRDGSNIWEMHTVVTELREHVVQCLQGSAPALAQAEHLFQVARRSVGDAIVKVQAQQRLAFEHRYRMVNECGARLGECVSADEIRRVFSEECERLGIERGYILLSLPSEGSSDRLTLFHSLEQGATHIPGVRTPYDEATVLPDSIWLNNSVTSWALLPLCYQARNQGFLLLELVFENGLLFETLRCQLSAALWSTGAARESVTSASSQTESRSMTAC